VVKPSDSASNQYRIRWHSRCRRTILDDTRRHS